MTFWLANHDKSEWPDLDICQTEESCHVTHTQNRCSKDAIEKMCPDEFFAKHKYKYDPAVTVPEYEYYDYFDCPKAGNSKANDSFVASSEYQPLCRGSNLVHGDHKYVALNQQVKEPHVHDSGYLSPIEAEQRSDNDDHSSNRDTTEGSGSKRSHPEICEAEAAFRTPHENTNSQVAKIKKRVVEYNNIAFSSDQDEATWYKDAESIPNYDTTRVAYENVYCIQDPGHTFEDEDNGFLTKRETCLYEYRNMKDDGSMDWDRWQWVRQNVAFGTSTHPKVPNQLVLSTETGPPHIEARYQEQETLRQPDQSDNVTCKKIARNSERYPIAPSELKDRKVEVTFDI